MKIKTCLLLGALCALFTGCATAPDGTKKLNVSNDQAALIASVVQPIAKSVVLPVLAKNPKYEPALLAIAAGVDTILMTGDQLTPKTIKQFLDSIAVQYDLTDDARLYIASGIDDLVTFYQQNYGTLVQAADPNMRKILAAFSAGIRDGVEFYHAMQPAAAPGA